MRALIAAAIIVLAFLLGFLSAGCAPTTVICSFDGGSAEACVAYRDGLGFVVAVGRSHESLEVDAPSLADGSTTFPEPAMLEYTTAAGVTCDATDGSATWGDDSERWCITTDATCESTGRTIHAVCVPAAWLR